MFLTPDALLALAPDALGAKILALLCKRPRWDCWHALPAASPAVLLGFSFLIRRFCFLRQPKQKVEIVFLLKRRPVIALRFCNVSE